MAKDKDQEAKQREDQQRQEEQRRLEEQERQQRANQSGQSGENVQTEWADPSKRPDIPREGERPDVPREGQDKGEVGYSDFSPGSNPKQ